MTETGLVRRSSQWVYLWASCVPLRAVVPSLLTNSLKLLSEWKQGIQKRNYHRDPPMLCCNATQKLKLCPAFIVAAVRKVLTLDNLLHDVVCINASVVHAAGLPIHSVFLPPVVGQEREDSHLKHSNTLQQVKTTRTPGQKPRQRSTLFCGCKSNVQVGVKCVGTVCRWCKQRACNKRMLIPLNKTSLKSSVSDRCSLSYV